MRAGHDHWATLANDTAVEARVSSALEGILLVMMRRLRLHRAGIAVDGHDDRRGLRPLSGRWMTLRADGRRYLIRLLQQLLVHDALALPLLLRRRLLRLVRVLATAQLELVLVSQLTIIDELAILLGRWHLQLLRVLLLLML